jgi:hypothetical protein
MTEEIPTPNGRITLYVAIGPLEARAAGVTPTIGRIATEREPIAARRRSLDGG